LTSTSRSVADDEVADFQPVTVLKVGPSPTVAGHDVADGNAVTTITETFLSGAYIFE
jgi:hypothetical protein